MKQKRARFEGAKLAVEHGVIWQLLNSARDPLLSLFLFSHNHFIPWVLLLTVENPLRIWSCHLGNPIRLATRYASWKVQVTLRACVWDRTFLVVENLHIYLNTHIHEVLFRNRICCAVCKEKQFLNESSQHKLDRYIGS